MNKELREEMEFLITCNDKAITPDVRDDVEMTLKYIDELEKENERLNNIINEVIDLIENDYFEDGSFDNYYKVMSLLKGEDNESN